MSGDELAEMLRKMVPQENLDFARKLLTDHGVPVQDEGEDNSLKLLGWTEATATPQVEVALAAPEDDADRERARHPAGRGHGPHPRRGPQGRGAVRLAVPGAQARRRRRRHHHRPGRRGRRSLRRGRLDRPVAAGRQGGRAGPGARRGRHRQRRADRRRARARLPGRVVGFAVADGRGVREHAGAAGHVHQGAGSRDTVRSRSFTGKPCRMLRNDWTDAWETPGNPEPLGMPLQYMVSGIAVAATHRYPDQTVDVAFNPVGQVVGQFEKVEKTAAVVERWVERVPRGDRAPRRAERRRRRRLTVAPHRPRATRRDVTHAQRDAAHGVDSRLRTRRGPADPAGPVVERR